MGKWISEPNYFTIRDRLLTQREVLTARFISTGEPTGEEIDAINLHLRDLLDQFANRWN